VTLWIAGSFLVSFQKVISETGCTFKERKRGAEKAIICVAKAGQRASGGSQGCLMARSKKH